MNTSKKEFGNESVSKQDGSVVVRIIIGIALKGHDMKRYTYEAVIERQSDGYVVHFPQLKDAFTSGDTREEALHNAAEVLALIVGSSIDEGAPLPRPEHVVECVNVSIALTEEDIESMRFITLAQAAESLEVTSGRITQLITAGRLEDRYFGGVRMVSIASVNRFKESPRKAGRPRKEQLIVEAQR